MRCLGGGKNASYLGLPQLNKPIKVVPITEVLVVYDVANQTLFHQLEADFGGDGAGDLLRCDQPIDRLCADEALRIKFEVEAAVFHFDTIDALRLTTHLLGD